MKTALLDRFSTLRNLTLDRVLVAILYVMVILLPLTYYGTIEVGFTVKLYEVVGALGFALLVVDRIRKRELRWRKTPLDIPLLGFWLVAALSLTQAVDLERGIAWWLWLSFYIFGFYYLIVNVVHEERHIHGLLKTYLVVAAVISAFALTQFFLDWAGLPSLIRPAYSKFGSLAVPRPNATFLEPLYFGFYLLPPSVFLSVSFLSKKSVFFKVKTEASLLLLYLTAMAATLSRGSIIALIGSLVILVALYLGFYILNKRKFDHTFTPLWPRFVVVLIAVIPIFFGITWIGLGLERVFHSTDADILKKREEAKAEESRLSLNDPRYKEWGNALKMFKNHPVLGVGLGNFGPTKTGVSRGISGAGKGFAIVNNEPLEVATETGSLGLLAYLGFNVVFVWQMVLGIWKSIKTRLYSQVPLFAGFLLSFLAMSAQFLTLSTIQIGSFWFILGMGAAWVALFERRISS